MSNSDSGPGHTSDGDIDFTIARSLSDGQLILALKEMFRAVEKETIEIDRHDIEKMLGSNWTLKKADAERLFTGLALNGAADQATPANSFADYSFRVRPSAAVDVLADQWVARRALESVGEYDIETDEVGTELAATLPPGIELPSSIKVRPIADELRQLCFDADGIVRIATPYIDPSPTIVGDVASLADRGIRTRILTRQVGPDNPGTRRALYDIYDSIDSGNQHLLEVRDLYKRDKDTGRQAFAMHAKLVITDREYGYIGSANLTDTSLGDNFELGVLLHGTAIGDAVDVYDTVFDIAQTVELDRSD